MKIKILNHLCASIVSTKLTDVQFSSSFISYFILLIHSFLPSLLYFFHLYVYFCFLSLYFFFCFSYLYSFLKYFLIIINFCRDIFSACFFLFLYSFFLFYFHVSRRHNTFASASLFCFSCFFYYFVVLKTTTERICVSLSPSIYLFIFIVDVQIIIK